MKKSSYIFLILFLIGLWGAGNLVFAQIPIYTANSYSVQVYKSGTGSGTVKTSQGSGTGIDCGNDCQENFWSTAYVTLEAFASPNSTFAGWYGCDSVNTMVLQGSLPTCSVNFGFGPNVPNKWVNAVFNSDTPWYQAKLTVTKSGLGSGSVFSNPSGISCGAVCSGNFSLPSYPLFTATLTSTGSLSPNSAPQAIHIGSGKIIVGGFKLQTIGLNPELVVNPSHEIIDLADGVVSGNIYALGIISSGGINSPAQYFLDVYNTSNLSLAQSVALPVDLTPQGAYNTYSKVYFSGNFVYVTRYLGSQGGAALLIFDISNPVNPVKVGELVPGGSPGWGIAAAGNYAYMGTQYYFRVIDVSDPANPVVAGTITNASIFKGIFNEVALAFPYVYVSSVNASDSSSSLYVIDVSKPSNPVLISTTAIDYFDGKLAPTGKNLFIGSTVYDVSNPFQPRKIGQGPGGVQYGGDTSFQVGSLNEGNDYVVAGSVAAGFRIYAVNSSPGTYAVLDFAPGLGIYSNPTVTLSEEPEDGSVFGAWSGATPAICGSNESCSVSVPLGMETAVGARFDIAVAGAPVSAMLAVTKSGNGSGLVSDSALNPSSLGGSSLGGGSLGFISGGIDCGADCSESYPADSNVILLATPSAGSDFVKWSGCAIGSVMRDDGALWNPATLVAKKSNGTNAWLASNYSALAFQNKLWVVGGDDGNTRGEVWSSADGTIWAKNVPAFNAPWWATKFGFSALNYGTKMWILGGSLGGAFYTNEVWSSFDGQNWTQELNAGWSPRVNFAVTRFNGSLWAFGGNAKENNSFVNKNDVWSSVGSSGVWNPVNAVSAWSPRQGHAAVAFNNKLWILGGLDAGGYKNDVWSSSNGVSWIQEVASANWPIRAFHKALVFDSKLWIMGGSAGASDFKNDVWYSADGINWTQSGLADWPGRSDFGVAVFNNKMWVLGGRAGSNLYKSDVWYSVAH